MNKRGFTVIELLVVTVLFFAVGVLFWVQKSNVEAMARDDKRRMALNAMYYTLEKVYYPANKAYPKTINATVLASVDADMFKDPNGVAIGQKDSNYTYEPLNCHESVCKGYTLRAKLEKEADYVKDSQHN